MKAWVLKNIGDISLMDREIPAPKDGEVVVRVSAAGICGSDIPRVFRDGAHNMPLVPGHEFSGVVHSVGKNVDEKWLNKRVGVYPLIPCGECGPCKIGRFEMCRNYDYIGSRRDGAFAEYVSVPADNLIEIPENVSLKAAAMIEPAAVAAHAMAFGIEEGSRMLPKDAPVAVCGLGTVGLLLVMLLKVKGYENLWLIGNKPFQRRMIEELGIETDRFIDSSKASPSERLLEKTGGVELYFECVGNNASLTYGVDAAGPGGRIITVGNPNGDMTLEKATYWKILRNQLSLQGTWNSDFYSEKNDWKYVIDRMESGRFYPERLITHRFPLSDLMKGLLLMRDKTEDYCKVMIDIEG